jgi:hypothetical protein
MDPWLAAESIGILVAAGLLVYGVAKLNVRFVVAAGGLAALTWLVAAWTNEDKTIYERIDYVTLRLRPVDAASDESVRGVTVQVAGPTDAGRSAVYRLPTSVERSADAAAAGVIRVSLFVKRRTSGSLIDRYRHPEATSEIEDQNLEIVAPGYRPWHGSLKQLLADDRSSTTPRSPLVIEMHRR